MRPNVVAYRSVKENNSLSTVAAAEHNLRGHPRGSYSFFQHQLPQQPPTLWTSSTNSCYNGNCHRQLKAVASLPPPPLPPATFHHTVALNHQQHNEKNVFNHRETKLSSFLPRMPAGVNPTQRNYAKLPINALNQQRVNECAGIPLISTATTHLSPNHRQRLQRKSSNSPTHNHHNPPPPTLPTSPHYSWHKPPNTVDVGGGFGSQTSRNCISQLAAHAQGLPLLLNKQQNQITNPHQHHHWGSLHPANCNNINFNVDNKSKPPTRYQLECGQNFAKDTKFQITHPHAISNSTSSTASSNFNCAKENFIIHRPTQLIDAVGTNIAEHVDLTETCLPRIIKPRKRRKKDRKPVNGVYVKMNDEENATLNHKNSMATNSEKQLSADSNLQHQLGYNAQNTHPQHHPFQSANYETKIVNSSLSRQIAGSQPNTIQCQRYKHNPLDGRSASICFCHQCDDPLRRIWDFPLRRSCSDSSATSADSEQSTASSASSSSSKNSAANSSMSPIRSRAEIVGVIGSNRFNYDVANSGNNKNNNDCNLLTAFSYPINAGCQSDSNDSGYGDILSGINIADDLFNKASSSNHCAPSAALEPASLLLHPKTAESLLNESINEISRKLLETCSSGIGVGNVDIVAANGANVDNVKNNNCINLSNVPAAVMSKPTSTALRLSSLSNASDFSSTDSGIGSASLNGDDLVFNFEQLNIEQLSTNPTSSLNNNNKPSNFNLHQSNLLFPPTNELLLEFELDLNNNTKGYATQPQTVEHNQQFFNNCFDFVWHNSNTAADVSTTTPPTSLSSSSAISFPLNPIRKTEASIFSA